MGLDIEHPLLDIAFSIAFLHIDSLHVIDDLALSGLHTTDLNASVVELQFRNTFEAFVDVSLDEKRILRLSENLKKILIGQEEESSEDQPLLLKVVAQTLLDLFQLYICAHELWLDFGIVFRGQFDQSRILLDGLHCVFPESIDLVEHLGLSRHSRGNVSRGEDWFELHPTSLGLQHLIHKIRQIEEGVDPLLGVRFEFAFADIRGSKHRLCLHSLIIECTTDIVPALDEMCAFVLLLLDQFALHFVLHFLEALLEIEFLESFRGDIVDFTDVLMEVVIGKCAHFDFFAFHVRSANHFANFLPILDINCIRGKAFDQRKVLGKLVDRLSQLDGDLSCLWVIVCQFLLQLEAIRSPTLDGTANLRRILNAHESLGAPVFQSIFDILGHADQRTEGSELLVQVVEIWIWSLRVAEEVLSFMELLDLLLRIVDVVVQVERVHHEVVQLVQFLEFFDLFELLLECRDLFREDVLLLG